MYGKRIETLCSLLTAAEIFADVGCDHGYCTEYMLKSGLCKKAVFSDISRGSLKKAETLLAPYIAEGRARAVLGDGLCGVPDTADEVLIAGMGGREIIGILSDKRYGFLPSAFVLQPMHDAEKLRRYLLSSGAYLERDFTFRDGKFYDVIRGRRLRAGEEAQRYTDAQFRFGRENLSKRPQAFLERTEKQLKEIDAYLSESGLQEASRRALEERKARLEEVLSSEAE